MDLEGWHPDPFGTHEQRLFRGGVPTPAVKDDGIGSYSEPPVTSSPAVVHPPDLVPAGGPPPASPESLFVEDAAPVATPSALSQPPAWRPVPARSSSRAPAGTEDPVADRMGIVTEELNALQMRVARFNRDGGTKAERSALLGERDRLFAERERLRAELKQRARLRVPSTATG
jgi:hypothetical protein